MKQQIAGSRHGVAPAGADFTKRVQLHRPRGAEQPVPHLGPKSHHARKSRFDVAKVHGAIERREVCAERAHCASVLRARLYGQHQKNRGARQRRGDRLSQSEHALRRIVRVLGIGFHRLSSWRRARNLVYFDSASTPPPTFGRQAYHRPPTNVHSASARAGRPQTAPFGGQPTNRPRPNSPTPPPPPASPQPALLADCLLRKRRRSVVPVHPRLDLQQSLYFRELMSATSSTGFHGARGAFSGLGAFGFSSLIRRVSPLVPSARRPCGLLLRISSAVSAALEFGRARCFHAHVLEDISDFRLIRLLSRCDSLLLWKARDRAFRNFGWTIPATE